MSTSSPDSPVIPAVASAVQPRRRISVAGVVTGLALGASVALALMWRTECRRSAYLEAQIAPLKAEAVRYRLGLQEEIARTMRLAEELKAKQAAAVSVR